MGSLRYGSGAETVVVDDWTLRHLQVVVQAKLRAQQSFAFYWHADGVDPANGAVWIAPGVPVAFRYDAPQLRPLNRGWLNRLLRSADDGALRVLPEDEHDSAEISLAAHEMAQAGTTRAESEG